MRVFSANITSMPSARLHFFESGSTTPKVTYADKQGTTPNTNPVIASSTGSFPPIYLDGLYRVELRSSANIVQPGWPIDNVGQDNIIVPFGPWIETVTYGEGEIVTFGSPVAWYSSISGGNLGNEPATSPSEWENIPIPQDPPEEIKSISLVGGFTSGSIHFSKVGPNVTISAAGSLFHSSSSSVSTPAGFVPVLYRPPVLATNVYHVRQSPASISMIAVDSSGTLTVSYFDFSGTPVALTQTPSAPSLSFNKA